MFSVRTSGLAGLVAWLLVSVRCHDGIWINVGYNLFRLQGMSEARERCHSRDSEIERYGSH